MRGPPQKKKNNKTVLYSDSIFCLVSWIGCVRECHEGGTRRRECPSDQLMMI